ncbi:MAG: oligosaccharide flippase family protein [Gemmatimonadetes bacterium]|nr:oligosaccharide flippase family protein [Gemmatimonadota bacterium]
MTTPAGGMRPTPRTHRRTVLTHGVAWNAVSEVAQVAFNFAAMLVLVRIIPPAEYGKATAATSVLVLLTSFSAAGLLGHVLQLHEGEDPDWTLHWHAAAVLQGGLFLAANVIAGVYWFLPAYRPAAPLLHVGSLGCLLNLPHLFAYQLLQRELDFRRSRLGIILSSLANTVATVALGVSGFGAYAIVIGAQVVGLLPLPVYLLVIRRWRPHGPWFAWPEWRRHAPSLRFGGQQMVMAFLATARGTVEAAVLPGTVGFAAIGLLGRANGLHGQTVGRLSNILRDTVYPLLPRSAGDPPTFARHTTLFVQATLLAAIPGAIALGLLGPELSRVLYGRKWIAADPLIWPVALAGLGLGAFGVGMLVVQAASRLRATIVLALIEAVLVAPLALVTISRTPLTSYAWLVAGGELVAGVLAIGVASRHLRASWAWDVFAPGLAAAAGGAAAVLALKGTLVARPAGVQLAVGAPAFLLAALGTLRVGFPGVLRNIVGRLKGGPVLLRWLALRPSTT